MAICWCIVVDLGAYDGEDPGTGYEKVETKTRMVPEDGQGAQGGGQKGLGTTSCK